ASLELIESGYHREAMFWIAVTHSRCQKVLSAPIRVRIGLQCAGQFNYSAHFVSNPSVVTGANRADFPRGSSRLLICGLVSQGPGIPATPPTADASADRDGNWAAFN